MNADDEKRGAEGAEDLRTLLGEDHARLDDLFTELLCAFEYDARDECGRLWTEFEAGLRGHMMLEEELILPRFALIDRAEAAALLDDHRQIRQHLLELGIGVDLHVTERARVAEFITRLRAHAAREDALMYRWVQRGIREPQVSESLRRRLELFRTRRRQLPTTKAGRPRGGQAD